MKNKGLKVIVILGILTGMMISASKTSIDTSPQSEEVIRLRLAETMTESQPAAMGASYFCQLVRERSNGRIKIEMHYQDMGEPSEILEQLKYGGISFARVNALDAIEQVPTLEDSFMIYVYESPESVIDWVANHHDLIMTEFQKEGMSPLVWYYPEPRCFYSTSENIDSVRDFENMKIKTCNTNLMRRSMEALGATSVYVENSDIYRSMLNAYMNVGEASFSDFVSGNYYDLVKYVTISNYIAPPDLIVASEEVWEDLSEEDQMLIRQCAQDTYAYEKDQEQQFVQEYLFRVGTKKNIYLESEAFSKQLKNVLKESEE